MPFEPFMGYQANSTAVRSIYVWRVKDGKLIEHLLDVFMRRHGLRKELKQMSEAKMRVDAMAGFAAPPFHPILTDAGGGPTFMMLGTTMRLIATATATGGRYTVIEQVTPPGWGPPRHIHSCEDEIFYILDGRYELHVGDERRTVSAGASAILPRNIPHGFRNVASTPSRLVFVITPGGLEEYFLAVAKCSPTPDPPQLVELARPFGLTLLPPGA